MTDIVKYEPAERVYFMRKAGLSFVDIAADMDMTTGEVVGLFRSFQTQMASTYGLDDRKALVHLELDRLDDLQSKVWPEAMTGDLKAVESVLKIMTTRMKLMGLDQLTPGDAQQVANILVVGNDKAAFLEALTHGRGQQGLGSADRDDGVEREEG